MARLDVQIPAYNATATLRERAQAVEDIRILSVTTARALLSPAAPQSLRI
jgi:hypothetical protein